MSLLTPFFIGLFSSVHCLVMCGGLCGLFCKNTTGIMALIVINLGRILTYVILGVLFAGIVQGLALSVPVSDIGFWLRLILGLALVILGVRIVLNKSSLRSVFGNNFLWQKANRVLQKITQKHTLIAHLSKGILWGFIPCGLLYGVLIAAASTNDFISGGLFMLAFGLGTLPSMMVAAGLFKSLESSLQTKSLRFGAGIFIIIIGMWSILSPFISHDLLQEHPVYTPIIAFLDSCIP